MNLSAWSEQLGEWKSQNRKIKVYMDVSIRDTTLTYQGEIKNFDDEDLVLTNRECIIPRSCVKSITPA